MNFSKTTFGSPKHSLWAFLITSLIVISSCSEDENVLQDQKDELGALSAKSSKSVELSYQSLTASTQQSGNPISNIDDSGSNYLDTRWSGFGTDANVDIDFGVETLVDYVNIAFHKGDERKATFTYWYSSDGSSWVNKGKKTSSGSTEGHQEFDLSNITARYFRIKFEGNTSNDWNSVLDLQIFGTPGDGGSSDECNATAPSGRSSEVTQNSAILSWNAIPNIDHYNVRYRPIGSSDWNYKYSLDTNTVTITGLLSDTDYQWQIRSKCSDGSASAYGDGESNFTTEEGNDDTPPTDGTTPEGIVGDFWKITLPIDTNGNGSDRGVSEYDDRNNDAGESYDLNGVATNSASEFSGSADTNDYLYVDNGWLVFRAFCGGATTENSQYPRSELRGLDETGDDNYFSMDDHQELEVTVKVLEVPVERPEVNMVQIHGPSEEPLRVEFNDGSTGSDQGLHLTVNEDDDNYNDIMDYSIGQELKVWVRVENGHLWLKLTNLDTNQTYETDYNVADDTGYWKVGCYLQGSITYCDVKSGTSFCKNGGESDDYDTTGAVAVKDLSLIRDGKVYK